MSPRARGLGEGSTAPSRLLPLYLPSGHRTSLWTSFPGAKGLTVVGTATKLLSWSIFREPLCLHLPQMAPGKSSGSRSWLPRSESHATTQPCFTSRSLRFPALNGITILGGTSLVGQWLIYHASITGGMGSIPGQGVKILYAVWCGQKKLEK